MQCKQLVSGIHNITKTQVTIEKIHRLSTNIVFNMNSKSNVVLLLILFLLAACNNSVEEKKLNMLIIQPDQHRADVMGCAGNVIAITPNLDNLASEGIRFSRAVSASPVCCPFRATLQTGLYIHEHGVVENGIQLKHELKTIGEIFSENGYATGYIGKWHLEGFLPKDRVGGFVPPGEARQGWQEWHGYEKSHEFFEVWTYNEEGEQVRVEGYDWEPTWHTDMALDFIKRKTQRKQPWCYYIAYGPPHKPEQCTPEFLNQYNPSDFILPPDAEENLSEAEKQQLRKILQMYYAQVTAVDFEVGRLLEGLSELDVAKNTFIVYVSDHGDVLGSHNAEIVKKYVETNRNVNNTLRTKGKPFASAMKIPLIISGPGIKKAGMISEALVSSVDLAPTILDLAGLEVPEYMQGLSMARWLREGHGLEQPYLYMGLHSNRNAWRAVWDGTYLLSMLDYEVFYDHAKDPFEMDNLFHDPDAHEKRNKYQSILIELAKETGDPILPRLEEAAYNKMK